MINIAEVWDLIIGALFAVGAWVWRRVIGKLDDLETKHEELEKSVIKDYVLKTDYDRSTTALLRAVESMRLEIKSDLTDISRKLDSKQDK
jgi:hypothetical protein